MKDNNNISNFIIFQDSTGRDALLHLDKLASNDGVLFVVDSENKLKGSITDGDIRRGLLKGLNIDDNVLFFANQSCRIIDQNSYTKENIKALKSAKIRYVPLISSIGSIEKVIDIKNIKSVLPVDAVIMAGGEGKRLRPLTENTPKPLLKVGDKAIIEHNIDRLIQYGIKNINITLRYQGQKIIDYLGDGSEKDVSIEYITETEPLGTIGALSLFDNFEHEHILVMNSDLLTNIDFEDFYECFINESADFLVATIPYHVNVPYAVMEMDGGKKVTNFREKPKYTYYSNAGIYLMKREVLDIIPQNKKFDATDLMETIIEKNKKLIAEPILGYWLDIGRMEDLRKAQEDIKHLEL